MPVEPPENEPEPVEETSAAEEWGRLAVSAGYLMGGGFQMAASTVVGWFLGTWIDGKLGIHAVFAAILALSGFVAGVWVLWRTLQKLQARQDSRTKS
jgi:F0F1-type ATP synthase assembly protein I